MHLEKLSLVNYKNILELELVLSKKINCFIGNNGVGKTNLLDAVYYLSFCKSYFSSTDQDNINHDAQFMILEGLYHRKDLKELVYCGVKRGQRKNFKRNKKEYEKLSEHIGLLPIVMVSPADLRLITDGSEERRKYMDSVISQYDRKYLDDLIRYNRALQQRNKLLKHFASSGSSDEESLSIWDEQLVNLGEAIYEKRKDFLCKLLPVFQEYYSFISEANESVALDYKSQLHNHSMRDLLKNARWKDQFMQHSTVGIHKDDLVLNLERYPIKKMGSQGQKKTYLIALKLAHFEFIRKVSGFTPILLLDDIFDKLDSNRVEQIVSLVSEERFGQIFISDTNRDHLDEILSNSSLDYQLFVINRGGVIKSES